MALTHMQRLRDLAAISNTTALPIVPLHVVKRDLVGVTVGSAIVLFAVVLALALEIHSLPIGLSVLGVGIV